MATKYVDNFPRQAAVIRQGLEEKAQAEKNAEDTAKETEHLAKLHPPKGRGVIDTSGVDKDTLLPKKMAKGGSAKGWGKARGARAAKYY